jgi:glycosyltransferase involved in cell wall biosynthesis
MRFSIVTVTLNAEKFLEQTLLSVAGQIFSGYEHIVWDGGSVDHTIEIIQRFPHAKLFSGQDSGISDAMNRGAQFASGEYIIHLHADDCLAHERVLAELDQFLCQRGDPPWVYGQVDIIDHEGGYQRTSQLVSFDARRLRKYNTISHPATVLSRRLFVDSGGFRTDLKYCMDYELWLRLARSHEAIAMPVVVAKFRGHQGSLSTRETKGVADEAYRVRNEYVKNIWERFLSYRTWRRRCKKIQSNT